MRVLSGKSNNWESILKYGTRQFFKRKTVIYHQDTYGDGFYFLHKGLVKILTSTLKGNERLLNIVFPGQIVGIQAMDQNRYVTTAITAKDSVLYFFPCEQILELLTNHPESMNLISETVIRNTNVLLQSIYLDTMTSVQRISSVLLTYHNEMYKNEVYLTVQDLASYTGLTRITVYKILKEWEREGIIAMEDRKFEIKRPDLLQTYYADM